MQLAHSIRSPTDDGRNLLDNQQLHRIAKRTVTICWPSSQLGQKESRRRWPAPTGSKGVKTTPAVVGWTPSIRVCNLHTRIGVQPTTAETCWRINNCIVLQSAPSPLLANLPTGSKFALCLEGGHRCIFRIGLHGGRQAQSMESNSAVTCNVACGRTRCTRKPKTCHRYRRSNLSSVLRDKTAWNRREFCGGKAKIRTSTEKVSCGTSQFEVRLMRLTNEKLHNRGCTGPMHKHDKPIPAIPCSCTIVYSHML